MTLKSLRDSIGIVPQDAILFSASIRENVQYGRPGAPDANVWHALEQANIRDFVESLPDQLDTMIGEGGVRPSTGQRQRLALARVFLKNPPILILDEATSGLDSEVENLIHDAVRRLMKGRTSFLIAHRLASAVDADVIVVLDRGKIVEVGAHAELVKRAGVYSQLFNEQTRKLRLTPEHIARTPGSLSPAPTSGKRSKQISNLAMMRSDRDGGYELHKSGRATARRKPPRRAQLRRSSTPMLRGGANDSIVGLVPYNDRAVCWLELTTQRSWVNSSISSTLTRPLAFSSHSS